MTVVLGLMASVAITLPLWSTRPEPPLLPALDLPSISLGIPLLVSCVAALFLPGPGTLAATALIAFGMVTDQTRMQPQFFSLPLLLWGTLPSRSAQLIARVHLVALWFYAGLHKLLSDGFFVAAGRRILDGAPIPMPLQIVALLATAAALFEVGTALLAVVPALRRFAAWAALLLHAGILFALFSGDARNVAVWPWNVVLACSGFALIAPWRGPLLADLMRVSIMPRAITLLILVVPLGFYGGLVDAYPAHNLYSSGTASATVYCPAGCRPNQDVNSTWYALNVPLPPQPRLFDAAFNRSCAPGDVLRIIDPHPPPWHAAAEAAIRFCPAGTLPASHP